MKILPRPWWERAGVRGPNPLIGPVEMSLICHPERSEGSIFKRKILRRGVYPEPVEGLLRMTCFLCRGVSQTRPADLFKLNRWLSSHPRKKTRNPTTWNNTTAASGKGLSLYQ